MILSGFLNLVSQFIKQMYIESMAFIGTRCACFMNALMLKRKRETLVGITIPEFLQGAQHADQHLERLVLQIRYPFCQRPQDISRIFSSHKKSSRHT